MTETRINFMVLGAPQTGKSTLINTLSAQVMSDDDGWRYGLLYVEDNLSVQFIEPPTHTNFDYMLLREVVAQAETDGMIVMLNATNSGMFGVTMSILETIRAHHNTMPIVIAANYQDSGEAWSAQDIQMGLGIPDEMPVIDCVAANPDIARDTVLALLYKVLGIAT